MTNIIPLQKRRSWREVKDTLDRWLAEPQIFRAEQLSIDFIEQFANEVKSECGEDAEISSAAGEMLRDVEQIRLAETNIRSALALYNVANVPMKLDFDLYTIQAHSAAAAARMVLVMRKLGWHRGDGKREHPAWQCIREVRLESFKQKKKLSQKELVAQGLARYAEETGEQIEDNRTFIAGFKKQVIDKQV